MSESPLSAMVLAAGRGERMQPLSLTRAKPALPVLGRSMVGRVIAHLASIGIREFSVNAHHRPKSIEDEVRAAAAGASIEVFCEETLMGTAGALVAPRERLSRHPYFVLHNADTLVAADVRALANTVDADSSMVAAVLVRPGATRGYRPLRVNDGRIVGVGDGPGLAATFLGVSVLRSALLEHVPPSGPSSLFEDVLIPAMERGGAIGVVEHDGAWLEFTSPASYRTTLCRLVGSSREAGAVALPGGDAVLTIHATGTLAAGPFALVESGAQIHGACVVERGARVHSGARLLATVVLEGAVIEHGAHLVDVTVDRDVRIPAHASYREGTVARDGAGLRFHPDGGGARS